MPRTRSGRSHGWVRGRPHLSHRPTFEALRRAQRRLVGLVKFGLCDYGGATRGAVNHTVGSVTPAELADWLTSAYGEGAERGPTLLRVCTSRRIPDQLAVALGRIAVYRAKWSPYAKTQLEFTSPGIGALALRTLASVALTTGCTLTVDDTDTKDPSLSALQRLIANRLVYPGEGMPTDVRDPWV